MLEFVKRTRNYFATQITIFYNNEKMMFSFLQCIFCSLILLMYILLIDSLSKCDVIKDLYLLIRLEIDLTFSLYIIFVTK